jgi:serine/threonine protein kinase
MSTHVAMSPGDLIFEPTSDDVIDFAWLAFQIARATKPLPEQRTSPALPASEPMQLPPAASPIKIDQPPDPALPADVVPQLESPTLDKPSPFTESAADIFPTLAPEPGLPAAQSSGIAFRSPAAPALPGALQLARAIRPLLRRVPSRTDATIDEEATVELIVEQQIFSIVLRPSQGRWLAVDLVVDEGASMVIWRETIVELRRMLERHGAFRDVRLWGMATDNDGSAVHLYARTGAVGATKRIRSPKEIIDPSGRRLILVVSDCISPAWWSGDAFNVLKTWSAHAPLAIVQLLPRRLWAGTALSMGRAARLHATLPGAPNALLVAEPTHRLLGPLPEGGLSIPIVMLDPDSLAAYARVLVGAGNASTPGFVLDTLRRTSEPVVKMQPPERADSDDAALLQNFREVASPPAWTLACYFSAAPLTLPVMRLVQRAMLPEPLSRQAHLAEVFLSGLLRRLTPSGTEDHPEHIQYDFVTDGVREQLLNWLSAPEAIAVLRSCISEYVEERTGQVFDFDAILATPDAIGSLTIDERTAPFASVTARVLRRLGGRYATAADYLNNQVARPQRRSDNIPASSEPSIDAQTADQEAPIDLLEALVIIQVGQLFGKYQILEHLGTEELVDVYRVFDTVTNEQVALDVIRPGLFGAERLRTVFLSSMRPLIELRHPNIMRIYDASELGGHFYITTELAGSSTLAQMIAARGRLPWAETMGLLEPLAGALDYAHEHDVVHANLNPHNIIVDEKRGPSLANFTVAQWLVRPDATLNAVHRTIGAPNYIAPEAWNSHAVPATDLYALSCIVYEMLTGNVLFDGDGPIEIARAHDRGPQFPATWPEGVPDGVADVLANALARAPQSRYQSAGRFWLVLKAAAEMPDLLEPQTQAQQLAPEDLTSQRIGNYEIIEVQGNTGMAMIYKAYQQSLDRYVMIKVLLSNRDPQFAARFKREIRTSIALQHQNILPIYDYGEQNGLLYLVMQYVENSLSLQDMLGSPMDPLQALRITGHVLNALDYAHKRGVLHRNIKPANVLMPAPDWPMLADFGIAKLLNDSQHLTMTGFIIGTVAYMAPEQAVGRPIDARTDLYSLGVVLYDMLTGRVPFNTETPMAMLTKHVHEPPPPPRQINPNLSPEIEAMLLRALSKDPSQRYQSAAAMAADLERLAAALGTHTTQARSETTRMLGNYEILEEIGRGGLATVYRARQTALSRDVALKVLHPQLVTDLGLVDGFRRVARDMATLSHPSIVQVYDYGETEGQLYIAMQLAEGGSLAKQIAERGLLSWEETLRMLRPICAAIDYVHSRNYIHRDIKPANILFDKQSALLADLGLARLLGETDTRLTVTGGVVGTPAYMAPEVWEENAASLPVDIYALACVVYEALTGEVLFKGQTPVQAMRAHERGPQLPETWPHGVPAGIAEVLGQALARNPSDRYPRAGSMLQALSELDAERGTRSAETNQEAVAALQRELEQQRTRVILGQALLGAPTPAAPETHNEIAKARQHFRTIQAQLRALGVKVTDLPFNELDGSSGSEDLLTALLNQTDTRKAGQLLLDSTPPLLANDLFSQLPKRTEEYPQITEAAEPLVQLSRYRIIAELGRGGFATIYRAMDSLLNREVALKVLHPQLLVDTSFVRRFEQEALTTASLRHPAIISIYDVGQEGGRFYIAMELAAGGNLAQLIGERGRIPWGEMLRILQPLAAALDYAHGQNVIHRDLTPSNILLDKQIRPLLSDFGLAALINQVESSFATIDGIAGTPSYVAPEIWNKNAASPASDLYALGCIVYEMLTGEKLFSGASPIQILYAHSRGPQFPAVWPESVPEGIAEVLSRAIAEMPADRYQSATALWQALRSLDGSQPKQDAAQIAALESQPNTKSEAPKQTGLLSLWRRLRGGKDN